MIVIDSENSTTLRTLFLSLSHPLVLPFRFCSGGMNSDIESLAFEEESFHDTQQGKGAGARGLPPLHNSPSPKEDQLSAGARRSPPKQSAKTSSAAEQLKKIFKNKVGRNRSDSVASNTSSIAFQVEGGDSSSTRQSSPPLIPPHRKSESPQYNASERSISFQVEGSVPQIPRNASPPRSISPPIANGVSNESIAFHVENDRNSSDNERSRGNLFVPLRDKAIHDGDESVAFQSVNNSFANVPAAFNDNTSIAFQMHDLPSTSIPAELPRPRKVSPTIAEKKVNQSAQSFASTGDDSIAFQVEDGSALYGKPPALLTQSANTSTVYDPIPLGDTRPHAGEDTGDDDFTMSPGLLSSTRVNKPVTKKTIVSNRLQTRSKDTSPVLKRLQLSPPPQKKESTTSGEAAPAKDKKEKPTEVNMPKKKKKASVRNDSLSSMNTFVRHDSPDNSNSSDDTSSVPLNRETTSPEFIRGETREWSQDPPEDTANTATPRRQNERSNSSNSAVAAPQLTKPPLPHPPRGSGKSTPKRFQSPGSISSDFPVAHQRTTTASFQDSALAVREAPETVSQVKEEADYWQLFNQEQREELIRLTTAISAARRCDMTLLEGTPVEIEKIQERGARRKRPETETRQRNASKPQHTPKHNVQFSSPIPQKVPPKPYPMAKGGSYANGKGTNFQKMQPVLNEKVSHHATPTRGQRRTPVKQTRTPNRTPSPPVKRPDQHSAEALADMLGILWPPTGTKLYFLNGTRLTAAQVDNFYETVDLQNKATELKRTGMETVLRATKDKKRRILSPSKLREVSPQTGRSPLEELYQHCSVKPKANAKRHVRRTRVLREVFELLDVKHCSVLSGVTLPSVKFLLENDLCLLEQKLFNRDTRMPIHQIQQRTLLDCARESRHCFETVWSQLGRPAERARSRSKSPLDDEEEEGDLQLGVKEQVLLEKARQARRALLYSFAVNVIIPLLIASCIDQFDFPTMSMIVFTAVNDKGKRVDAESKAWKGVVSQYFEVLDMNNQ